MPVLSHCIFRHSAQECLWIQLRNCQIRVGQVVYDLRVATSITDPGADVGRCREYDEIIRFRRISELKLKIAFSGVIAEPAPVSGATKGGVKGSISDACALKIYHGLG